MIYCIWYPSGGFGHFINAVISLYGQNFCRPCIDSSTLGSDGNSHALPLVLTKFNNQTKDAYQLPPIDNDLNYTVLIDNGIDDESSDFLRHFPGATTIKVCYDDYSWPVVASTHVIKAVGSDLMQEIPVDQKHWPELAHWSTREKFFLYLRDHDFRNKWRDPGAHRSITIDQLASYYSLRCVLTDAGIQHRDFRSHWQEWWRLNATYFAPLSTAQQIITAVKQKKNLDLTKITDVWTQSVICYYLWLHFGREIPHNDLADFFTCTDQIREWICL